MLPVIQIGPLAIQAPGLILLLGLWLGLNLEERYTGRFNVSTRDLNNLIFVGLIAGIIGARLAYAARYPAAFAANPASLVSLNPGLLDPMGGLAAAVVAGLIYGQRKGLALLPVLDALTPTLAVMAVAIGLSHLASGAAFGAVTDLPWGVSLWGARRHPSQVYEILGALMILVTFWPGRARYAAWVPGLYFLAFISASAGLYIFLQAFRGDSRLMANGLRANQLVAWSILAVCLLCIGRIAYRVTTHELAKSDILED